jgi:plasmid stability protein
MMNDKNRKPLVINLPADLHKDLKVRAAEIGTDMTSIVIDLIQQWIKDKKNNPNSLQ